MTQTAKQAADYEAKIALIQIGVKQFNDTVFSAPSFSGGHDHILTVINNEVTFCSDCKGFKNYGHCCHAIAVIRFIEAKKAAQEATDIEAAIAAVESVVEYEQEQEAVAGAVAIIAREQAEIRFLEAPEQIKKQIRKPYNTQNRSLRFDEKRGILLR